MSTASDRPPHPLDAVFYPSSIAVIGASSDARKIGGRPIAYMQRGGFARPVYPVNPTQSEIMGLQAYASIQDIGQPVDQAIIAVPGAQVAMAVEQAIAKQVRSIIVFSSGFGETGEAGRRAQDRMAARCAEAGVALVGPNCIGVFSAAQALYATFMTSIEHEMYPAGSVGIVSQSGAIGSYLYGMAGDRGMRFSHFIATGNEASVDVADCIAWMADDPATSVIMVYLEGCRDGEKLYRALARARAARKPVVVLKVGRTAQGAAAAASHTGSLAGTDAVYAAVLREAHAWRADSLEEMVEIAHACSVSPLPAGNRLGVITPSGGVGVITADEAATSGLVLPPLPADKQEAILGLIPFATGTNPVDTTAQTVGDRSLYTRILKLVVDHDAFDIVLSFNASMGRSEAEFAKVRADFHALRRAYPAKVFAICMRSTPAIVLELEKEGILYFSDPSRAAKTLGAMASIAAGFKLSARGEHEEQTPQTLPDGPLDEYAARALLEDCGIPFAAQRAAASVDDAITAAGELGYPVVLKILSPDIAHKSEVGGVALALADPKAVRAAWPAMMQRVSRAAPQARLEGAIVSPMVSGGVETVVGVVRDPVFGPMVMFGLGGVFVEVFKDVTFRRAPVDVGTAHEMIREIQGYPLLTGARGKAPVDLDTLARAIVKLSVFAYANRHQVASVEINPFIALPGGGCAVDAWVMR
ncbi:MAG: acetate--CoA ligase family protein [Pseudomonadota bacterium]